MAAGGGPPRPTSPSSRSRWTSCPSRGPPLPGPCLSAHAGALELRQLVRGNVADDAMAARELQGWRRGLITDRADPPRAAAAERAAARDLGRARLRSEEHTSEL